MRGNSFHSLDSKSRIVIPNKFRDALGDRFVITKGIGKCLFVFTENEFLAFEAKIAELPTVDPEIRRFTLFFFGGAYDAETDSNGRVVIPQDLREHAGIVKDIITMGVPGRLEIWSKEIWNDYSRESNFIDTGLAKKMAELGI